MSLKQKKITKKKKIHTGCNNDNIPCALEVACGRKLSPVFPPGSVKWENNAVCDNFCVETGEVGDYEEVKVTAGFTIK